MRRLEFSLDMQVITEAGFVWEEQDKLWLVLKPLSRSLAIRAGTEEQIATHKAHMHYRADIRPGMRFRRDGRILYIHTVEDIGERHRRLACLCEEYDKAEPVIIATSKDNAGDDA